MMDTEIKKEYSIYCDESCHLENDSQKSMVLGALLCPTNKIIHYNNMIRDLKKKHHIAPHQELKWTKVSQCNINLYLDIVLYFFSQTDLSFRGVIIPDKRGSTIDF